MFNFQLSRCRDLNSGPLPYQGSALPLSYIGIHSWSGRRGSNSRPSAWKANALSTELLPQFFCGQRWIRTTEGVSQQIYSLPHLATLVFALIIFSLRKERASVYLSKRINLLILEPLVGFEPTTPRLQITCSGQLS